MKLDPRTVASIQLNSSSDHGEMRQYACGCRILLAGFHRWWPCSYHQGYEDALAAIGGEP